MGLPPAPKSINNIQLKLSIKIYISIYKGSKSRQEDLWDFVHLDMVYYIGKVVIRIEISTSVSQKIMKYFTAKEITNFEHLEIECLHY